MKISALNTFTDWTAIGGAWGTPGVYAILGQMKIAGITDVYWRAFNGGFAMYPSKVAQVEDRYGYDEWQRLLLYPQPTISVEYLKATDFNQYDPLQDAVDIARELGINLYIWYTVYEDDHGGAFLGRFAKEHPEYWQMDREGRSYSGTQDIFYAEVRRHKLAIIDELLAYGARGLLLDYVRHNGCPSADKNGIHRMGYNPEIRASYKSLYGVDPLELAADDATWLAFKRDLQTGFVREVRRKMTSTAPGQELSLMLWPVQSRTWLCLDVPQLSAAGDVDMVTSMSIKYSIRPQEGVDQYHLLKSQVDVSQTRILPGICCYDGNYPGLIDDYVERAEQEGIEEMMLYEADAVTRSKLLTTIRAINLGEPNYTRRLTATYAAVPSPAEVDWSCVPENTGFLFNYGKKTDQVPSEETSVQIAYTDRELVFRFTCHDANMAVAMAPHAECPEKQYYLDALGSRTAEYYMNSFNVFLDPKHSHQDYIHLGVSPQGERSQQAFSDEEWNGAWEAAVEAQEDRWTGVISIPFASLGVSTPTRGSEWGINLLRGIRAKEETSIWFYILWNLPFADDLGHLRFG
jgi:hypothetical protein